MTVGMHPPSVASSVFPLQIYPHYESTLLSTQYALTLVSIQGPSPIHSGTLCKNMFTFVVGSLFVCTNGGLSLIDASQMTVIPAKVPPPPLSTDNSLFPQFAVSYVVGFGHITADRYTLFDHLFIIAITMLQHVRDSVKTFEVVWVYLSLSPPTHFANSFTGVFCALWKLTWKLQPSPALVLMFILGVFVWPFCCQVI